MSRPLILSIQSHTVHGYVGNKCSTFPVQLLGINIDPLNSVQLSNHKAYPKGAKGYILQGDQLDDLIAGLRLNDIFATYTHLLTGYIASASFLDRIVDIASSLRAVNPACSYFCDPVLGDHGKLYVPAELVDLYRTKILPIATVLTPNQFECELLTGMKINCVEDAWAACTKLHGFGIAVVVITSCLFGDRMVLLASRVQDDCAGVDGKRLRSASSLDAAAAKERYMVDIPVIQGRFSGTGDLTAALLLAWTIKLGEARLDQVLAHTCNSVRSVVLASRASFLAGTNPFCELCLVECAQDIATPAQELRVQKCN